MRNICRVLSTLYHAVVIIIAFEKYLSRLFHVATCEGDIVCCEHVIIDTIQSWNVCIYIYICTLVIISDLAPRELDPPSPM